MMTRMKNGEKTEMGTSGEEVGQATVVEKEQEDALKEDRFTPRRN